MTIGVIICAFALITGFVVGWCVAKEKVESSLLESLLRGCGCSFSGRYFSNSRGKCINPEYDLKRLKRSYDFSVKFESMGIEEGVPEKY